MDLVRKNGATSNVLRTKLRNSTTGQGLTGLTSGSSGLIISTICDNESAATNYTAGGSTIETVSGAVGTYAAPTATKCRFVELSSANQPGVYEIHLADARFAATGAKALRIAIFGATNLLEKEILIQLTSADLDDAVRFGLTAMPNVASGSAGAIITSGTGTAQLAVSSGHVSNVDTLTTYTGNTVQTGDSYGRIGATGSGLTSLAQASVWTSTRGGYVDNINNANLPILKIGRDGAVATSNRGYTSHAGYASPAANLSRTIYVRTTGDDGNSGTAANDAYLTIAAAIADRISGGDAFVKIDIAGAISLGSGQIALPAATWLSGDGSLARSGTTEITSTRILASGAIITAADNCLISSLKVRSTAAAGQFAAPIGYAASDTASRNVIVRDVDIVGDSDGVYFSGTTCNGWWRFYNCTATTKWDASVIINENATHVSEFWNCTLTAAGPSASNGAATSDIRPIAGTGGTQRLFNCTVTGSVPAAAHFAYGIHSRGAMLVEVFGGTISGADYDFGQVDRGVIVARGVAHTGSTSGNLIELEDGLDWSKLRNKTTTNALIGTTVANAGVKLRKNAAFPNFTFYMQNSSGNAVTGSTITSQRALDGAAFGNCTNSATEIGSGAYKISLSAADLNADDVMLKFTGTGGAKPTMIKVITQP